MCSVIRDAVVRADAGARSRCALRCFRGIDTVTAMTILAELHDFRRFEDPRHLMAYLGLVPSEHSSGERTHRGPITKTGNSHVRRILVEAAWHYRHRPAVGVKLRKRREGQPQEICAIADKARVIRIPVHVNEKIKKMWRVARELAEALGRKPRPPLWPSVSSRRKPAARRAT